jgi:transcriptional regulator of acetoin/glycerol metabolism
MAYLCTMAADREQIELEDLPEKLSGPYRANLGVPTPVVSPPYTDVSTLVQCIKSGGETDFYGFLKQIEGRLLAALYEECGSNLSQLCKSIKVSRSHLYAKLNEHGILK